MNLSLIYRLLLGNLLFLLCWSLDGKSIDSITSDDVEAALKRAQEKVKAQETLKRDLIAKGKVLNPLIQTAEARHQLKTEYPRHQVSNIASAILVAATQDLVSRFGLSKEDIEKLSQIPLDGEIGRQIALDCEDNRVTNCDRNSKFRTIDGSCNNLQRPNEGRIGSCLQRLAENDYEDRVAAPRTQGGTLPNPRDVSINIHRVPFGEDYPEPYLSVLFMTFGQFMVHDIEFTTQPQDVNNALINCCPISTQNHPECLPIPLRNDPDFDRDCMNFVRDAICPQCLPRMTIREQSNTKTSFLDCSQVYGTTEQESSQLRSTNNDGKLASTVIDGVGELPPPSPITPIPCGSATFPCRIFGDFRANQNLGLFFNQLCWFRLHNLIVDMLKAINPSWSGERMFQETRRIVIAFFQHIIFNEYVPQLIGVDMMRSYGLHYYNTQYDINVSALLINEVAAAVFRYGHSTVPNTFWGITANGQVNEIPLRDTFFNIQVIYQRGVVQDLARGSFQQPQQYLNRFADRSVTQFLYLRQNTTPALDLAAININRGRDHGLQGYAFYARVLCRISINSFDDLKAILYSESVDRFKSIYRSYEDIDLWSGVISERKISGAFLGCVGASMMAEQLFRLKYGDRFFFTHRGEAGSFTSAQSNSISRISLARVLCTVFNLNEVALFPFELNSPIYSCRSSQIPPIDLSAWKV